MASVNTITGISPEALMYPQPGDGRLCVMKVFVGTKQTLEYLLQDRIRKQFTTIRQRISNGSYNNVLAITILATSILSFILRPYLSRKLITASRACLKIEIHIRPTSSASSHDASEKKGFHFLASS